MEELLENKFWILLLLTFSVGTLKAQEKSIFGKVIDSTTVKGVANVNILNKRSGEIVVTNEKGDFYLRALAADSIIITNIGYERKGFKWDGKNKQPVINVKQQPIMLDELVVKDKKLSDMHKEILDFLANPNNSKAMRNQTLKNMINTNTSQPGIGISIDALYDLWSKEGKSKRKLADMQFEDVKSFYADLKYNKKVVAQITHLREEDLDDFMKFCNLQQEFVLTATDYELTFEILKYAGDFRQNRIYRKIR
jgi:hypothetical protein